MNCPWCAQPLKLAKNNAFRNADTYGNVNTVLAICCNRPVEIIPQRTYRVEKSGRTDMDDWDNNIPKPKSVPTIQGVV